MRIIHCSLSTSTLAGRRFITKDYLPTTHFQWNFNRLARRLKIEKWLNRVPVHTQFITSYSSHRKKRNRVSIQQTQTVRTSLRFTNNSFPPPLLFFIVHIEQENWRECDKGISSFECVCVKERRTHSSSCGLQPTENERNEKKKNRNKYKIRARPHTLSIGPISRRKLHRENDSIFSSGSHTHKRRIPTNQQKKRGKTYCTFFSVFLLLDRLKLSNSVSYGESKRVDMDNGGSTVRP